MDTTYSTFVDKIQLIYIKSYLKNFFSSKISRQFPIYSYQYLPIKIWLNNSYNLLKFKNKDFSTSKTCLRARDVHPWTHGSWGSQSIQRHFWTWFFEGSLGHGLSEIGHFRESCFNTETCFRAWTVHFRTLSLNLV